MDDSVRETEELVFQGWETREGGSRKTGDKKLLQTRNETRDRRYEVGEERGKNGYGR
jgi:hypothetical protein